MLHVGFALGKSSDQIGIYDGSQNPVDVVSFTNQIEDRSQGRLPDGSSNWIMFDLGAAALALVLWRVVQAGPIASACMLVAAASGASARTRSYQAS